MTAYDYQAVFDNERYAELERLRKENTELRNQLNAESMAYYLLRDERDAINDKYLELQQEYRKMVALADAFKAEIDQLREQLSIAEDDYYGD